MQPPLQAVVFHEWKKFKSSLYSALAHNAALRGIGYTNPSCYLPDSQARSPPSPPLKRGGHLKSPLFKGGKGGI